MTAPRAILKAKLSAYPLLILTVNTSHYSINQRHSLLMHANFTRQAIQLEAFLLLM